MYTFIDTGVDESRALIYMWEIRSAGGDLIGRYVGKAAGGSKRPRGSYVRRVEKLNMGLPYRASKPDGFRRIHRALAAAVSAGHTITLQLLCNVGPGENINEVERHHIGAQGSSGREPWQLND